MKRRKFVAIVTSDVGNTIIGERIAYAWNSAIRATEAIVREYARERTVILSGGNPQAMGKPGEPDSIYRRRWSDASGRELTALVYLAVNQ